MASIYNKYFKLDFESICGDYPYIPFVYEPVEKIISYGDIHGDYKMAIKLLLISGVAEIISETKDANYDCDYHDAKLVYHKDKEIRSDITYKLEWIGGKTHVVQVGDQVDRCRNYGGMSCELPETTLDDEHSDIKILKLFTDLHMQAIKVGGAVISLLGNHEINNALGRLEYVSAKGLLGFESYKDPKNPDIKFNSGYDARKYAFAPGNEYGKFLGCTRTPAVIIGSNLFVHAGIVNELFKKFNSNSNKFNSNSNNSTGQDIKKKRKIKRSYKSKYNSKYNSKYMLNYDNSYLRKNPELFTFSNKEDFEHVNIIIKKWLLNLVDQESVMDIIGPKYASKSMFWNRILGFLPANLNESDEKCTNNIDKVLKLFKINNIIIGHTPQSITSKLNINATCGKKVWRVDTATSSAFDRFDQTYVLTGKVLESRKFQYLVIVNDSKYNICYEDVCESAN